MTSPISSIIKNNSYLVSLTVSLAAFMELLDTTIANVALSHIAGSLGAGQEESTWVLTSYLISNCIVMPISGWLSALMGRKNYFILCILSFTLTSFCCGIATSLPILIFFRFLQGLAGGGMQPVQQAIIRDSFPAEKVGIAIAITGFTSVLAPILGPTFGGFITDNYSWRWIFFINLPIGLLAAFLVNVLVSDPVSAQKKEGITIDYIGLGLVSISLSALQIVLDKGQQEDWFDSSFIVFFSFVAAISLLVTLFWLWHQSDPIIDIKLLTSTTFSTPCIMLFFLGFTLWGGTSLFPTMLQSDFGYTATLSGLVLSPSGIVPLLLMPLVGKLVNKIEARYLIAIGMFINAIGMWLTGLVTPQTDYTTFAIARCFQTAGLPFLLIPATALAFSGISNEKSSNASAIISLVRNLGGSIGISFMTSRLIHSQQIEQAYLTQHLTAADPGYQNTFAIYTQTINNLGISGSQTTTVIAHIYKELLNQASILAYRDVYHFMSFLLIGLGIAALFMPNKIKINRQKEGI